MQRCPKLCVVAVVVVVVVAIVSVVTVAVVVVAVVAVVDVTAVVAVVVAVKTQKYPSDAICLKWQLDRNDQIFPKSSTLKRKLFISVYFK